MPPGAGRKRISRDLKTGKAVNCWGGDGDADVAFVHAHEVPGTKARVFEPPAKLICSSAGRTLSIVNWASVLVEDQAMGDDIHSPWSQADEINWNLPPISPISPSWVHAATKMASLPR